jgi:hypothetical protein
VFETRDEGTPAYFILLDWRDDGVAGIRDFRFARYALDGAELLTVQSPAKMTHSRILYFDQTIAVAVVGP